MVNGFKLKKKKDMKNYEIFNEGNNNVKSFSIRMKVIGKDTEPARFLRSKKYVVALQIDSEHVTGNPTMSRKVSFAQYSSFSIGEYLNVMMYTNDYKMWYLSEEDAAWEEATDFS